MRCFFDLKSPQTLSAQSQIGLDNTFHSQNAALACHETTRTQLADPQISNLSAKGRFTSADNAEQARAQSVLR